jgi:hypothetical protein
LEGLLELADRNDIGRIGYEYLLLELNFQSAIGSARSTKRSCAAY